MSTTCIELCMVLGQWRPEVALLCSHAVIGSPTLFWYPVLFSSQGHRDQAPISYGLTQPTSPCHQDAVLYSFELRMCFCGLAIASTKLTPCMYLKIKRARWVYATCFFEIHLICSKRGIQDVFGHFLVFIALPSPAELSNARLEMIYFIIIK